MSWRTRQHPCARRSPPTWQASTPTSAGDQLRLLRVLAEPDGPLSPAARSYPWSLLGHVEPDQRWGVPHAAGTAATGVYVKNGWWPNRSDLGRWIINSIGRIIEPGHDWLVVVLSDHDRTEDGGIGLVERIASIVVDGLRQATASPSPTPIPPRADRVPD